MDKMSQVLPSTHPLCSGISEAGKLDGVEHAPAVPVCSVGLCNGCTDSHPQEDSIYRTDEGEGCWALSRVSDGHLLRCTVHELLQLGTLA